MNKVIFHKTFPSGVVLSLVQGDITTEQVDAIVNAANSHLQHGGGVAGIIMRRGGYVIQQESDAWVRQHGPVSHAEPAVTQAGSLPCRFVIHAVGPVWGEGDEDAKLAAAVIGSLRRASEQGLQSIALPALSTGIFGFPKEGAARVILQAIQDYQQTGSLNSLRQVHLVLFDQPTIEAFTSVWKELGWDE